MRESQRALSSINSSTFDSYREQHRVPGGDLPYARAFALWLEDVQKVAQPVHFYKLWGLRAGVLWGIAGLSCLPAAKAVPLAKSKVAPAARVARRQGSTVLKASLPLADARLASPSRHLDCQTSETLAF